MIGRMFAAALGLCSLLCAAPAAAEMVPVDGGRLHVESCGAGQRGIVLVHDGLKAATLILVGEHDIPAVPWVVVGRRSGRPAAAGAPRRDRGTHRPVREGPLNLSRP